ncbi:site-specific integrase [Nostoc sp. CHAB 5834]|nr:site-specific integrase [Nostoc sp. CHAB 5834]
MLQLEAANDFQALDAFLSEHEGSSATFRLYRRETERLFLWAWIVKDKPVSSLNREDFDEYLAFLADPQPAQYWCGPRAPQESSQWKPFVGKLNVSAGTTALSSLNSLFTWWTNAGYLKGNPLGLMKQKKQKLYEATRTPLSAMGNQPKMERFLDADMWKALMCALEQLPRETPADVAKYERAVFLVSLLYLLVPRAGELETHRMNSFQEHRGRWWWHVVGKGQKEALIPVPDDMLTALVRYRKFLGLSAVPSMTDTSPLLRSVRDGSKITARQLNRILKELFLQASNLLPDDQVHKREKMRRASAHWGRHTGITGKVDAGMEMRYVQRDARHADARTTEMYSHVEDERWHDEAQKHQLPK